MVNSLISALKQDGLDALLVSSQPNITYLTTYPNFSETEREAYIFVTKEKQCILTDNRYAEAVRKQIKDFTSIETGPTLTLIQAIENLIRENDVKFLGIEENNLTVSEFKRLPKGLKLKDFSLSPFRTIKSEEEIHKIKKACRIADKAFSMLLEKIKPGVTEKWLRLELELLIRKLGGEPSFSSIVAFGPNAAIPHHLSGNDKLTEKNNLILLDFGAKFENYCSDMTRVVFLGRISDEQKQIYNIVCEAQKRAVNFLAKAKKPIDAVLVDKVARDFIESKNYPAYLHGLGHGIGVKVHESPRISLKSKDNLRSGMVFSVEPGIYLPGNCGVRIEDVFAIDGQNLVQLTKATKRIIEL